LTEISPIYDYTGKEFELWFSDYRLDPPKMDDREAKQNNASYESALRVKARLVNKKTGEIKEQEVFLGDFPLMTDRATFVVNGVERVAISQLLRSPGVFFTENTVQGKRLFGAKIIPYRGAWLEFETDAFGMLGVKIDRKRRLPSTVLLKAFGVEEDQIRKVFAGIDTDKDLKYIEETLKRDSVTTADEAVVEVYRRLRPGDLATADNARSLLESMFFNFDRYDLSKVGRWRTDQRLGEVFKEIKKILGESASTRKGEDSSSKSEESSREKGKKILDTVSSIPGREKIEKEDRLLKKEDIIAVMWEIIRLNNTVDARPDEIDHLGNRRVRSIGELLQNRIRVGLTRMERIVKDRMSTLDSYTITPAQLINARPVAAALKEFFTSSQLCQFMDNENPLAELEHKRRLTATGPGGLTRERAGLDVRDVQPSHYGRICPVQTPEGPNIGLVGHLAIYARINPYGFIETPYFKVEKGQITEKLKYMNAYEEERYTIAHAGASIDDKGKILSKKVEARVEGEPTLVDREKVDYIDVAPHQFLSLATSLIPFLEHDDANRAQMGSNMQRQAVPTVRPQAPYVGTGMEERAAQDSGQVLLADEGGEVVYMDAKKIIVKNSKEKERVYILQNFLRTNQYTSVHHRPIVRKGQKVKQGDVLADGTAVDDGVLALGQNLTVAFMSWRGNNFEDAIIISERLVKDDRFTSIHIEDFSIDVRETKLGAEVTTYDIPNVGDEKLKDLDEEGVVRVGAEVGPGSILVGKISPKGEVDLTPEERLLRAIFGEKAKDVKDTSLLMPHGKKGRVVGVKIFSREHGDKLEPGVMKQIRVEVAQLRKINAGDKLAGRHGNKGVIAVVLPEEDLPYLEDGTPVDIVLNPLSVASRMNLGQVLETHLGLAAKKLGYRALVSPLASYDEKDIKEELKKAGFAEDGKMTVYDGFTGKPFEEKITVGVMYMMKLIHMVEDKIHMRSIGPYSLITQQPLGGKAQFGGQRFGEMEVWALEGYGAAHTLQEMLTIKSDDVLGRSSCYEAIVSGEEIPLPNIPASFNLLMNELKALALDVEVEERMPRRDDARDERRRPHRR